jgi:hypothetical protein
MKKNWTSRLTRLIAVILAFMAIDFSGFGPGPLHAAPRRKKDKKETVSANDATAKLYKLLDDSFGGKLDLYLLADIYSDPSNPGQEYQRVIRVVYNKDLFFGRFTIHVRSVGKMDPAQLATYSPQAVFNFGGRDTQEFEKINPGPFGTTGDLFLEAVDDRPLAASPITDDVQQEYEMLMTKYILPAVEKQAAGK